MTIFIKLSILLYVNWSEYFAYVDILLRQFTIPLWNQVNLSIFWRYICKINSYWSGNFRSPPVYLADLYYSEIISGINTYFEQVYKTYSSCALELHILGPYSSLILSLCFHLQLSISVFSKIRPEFFNNVRRRNKSTIFGKAIDDWS